MSESVWKYELRTVITELDMPWGAEILTVQVQNGMVCLWAKVDPNAPKAPRKFEWVGTGHVMNDAYPTTYIGTVILSDGYLVFHVFERH